MPIIDFTNVEKVYRGSVEMKKVYEGSTVVWEKPVDNKSIPLYIELVNPADSVNLQVMSAGTTTRGLQYSYDNQNWTGYAVTNNPYTIALNSSNPRVYFRDTTNTKWSASSSIYYYFQKHTSSPSVPLNVGGNIFSLEHIGTSYQNIISPRGSYSFYMLFKQLRVVDASNLYLGEANSVLADGCYSLMFQGCASLTAAPKLPATTLATYCYAGMFQSSPLTQAPELPATTLVSGCYSQMFLYCSHLNYVKCLATNPDPSSFSLNWLYGVSVTGTFVKDVNTTWPAGVGGIPSGWTVQNA